MNNTTQLYHQFQIAGMRFYPVHKTLDIKAGDELTLILEPDNKFAKHPAGAIAVAKNGEKIGHVPEVDLEKMHPVVSSCQNLVMYADLAQKYPAVIVGVIV